jgi:hypothetical protein
MVLGTLGQESMGNVRSPSDLVPTLALNLKSIFLGEE